MKKVILKDGQVISLETWQKRQGLPSDKLSDNFSVSEFDCNGELLISEVLVFLLQEYRNRRGPVTITSGYRTPEYQKNVPGGATNSPHPQGMAADIDGINKQHVRDIAKDLTIIANEYSIPTRMGYKQYLDQGKTFLHVDITPFYFAPGMPYHSKKHPSSWETNGLTW